MCAKIMVSKDQSEMAKESKTCNEEDVQALI